MSKFMVDSFIGGFVVKIYANRGDIWLGNAHTTNSADNTKFPIK